MYLRHTKFLGYDPPRTNVSEIWLTNLTVKNPHPLRLPLDQHNVNKTVKIDKINTMNSFTLRVAYIETQENLKDPLSINKIFSLQGRFCFHYKINIQMQKRRKFKSCKLWRTQIFLPKFCDRFIMLSMILAPFAPTKG